MHIRRRLFLLPLLLLAFAPRLQAQVKVEMGFERRLWVLYEPIPVTVAITNLSGHDLHLADTDTEKWFSFQITQDDGPNERRVIAPLDINYKMSPLVIPVGATVKTRVNLSNLYEVQDIGLYRFKATVYDRDTGKYYSSMPDEIEVTEGKVVWEQTVGVPSNADEKIKGAHRTISVLTFRQPRFEYLYVRVQDKDTNTIYSTSPLGILVAEIEPDIKLDKGNTLHVLQLVGPRTFIYSRVDLNGGYEQVGYTAQKSRPVLKKDNEGEVYVSGGEIASAANTPDHPQHVETSQPTAADGPKVSDRPPGFPTVPGGR